MRPRTEPRAQASGKPRVDPRAIMGTMLCTVIASALLMADAAPVPETFASGLSRILRAAPEEFKPLRGARIDIRPGRDSWFEGRINLPGAVCRAYEHPRPAYRCRWERSAGRRDMRPYQRSLASDVEAALGEGWMREDAGGKIRFTRERDGASVQIDPATASAVELVVEGGRR